MTNGPSHSPKAGVARPHTLFSLVSKQAMLWAKESVNQPHTALILLSIKVQIPITVKKKNKLHGNLEATVKSKL